MLRNLGATVDDVMPLYITSSLRTNGENINKDNGYKSFADYLSRYFLGTIYKDGESALADVISGHTTRGDKNFDEVIFPLIRTQKISGSFLGKKDMDYHKRAQKYYIQAYGELFSRFDAMVVPSVGGPANPIAVDELRKDQHTIGGQEVSEMGMPAVTVQMGWYANGIPLTIQFIGPHFSEKKLFDFAAAYESATHYHRPPHF